MTLCTSTTAVVAAAGRPKTPRRLAAAVNIRRSSAGGGGGGSHSPLRRPLLREDLLAASAPQQKSQRRHRHRRWVVNASAGPDGGWRVRQIYGDGKVLLDQLREVAELLADGFNASGRSSKDLLNGLVQKVRSLTIIFFSSFSHCLSSSRVFVLVGDTLITYFPPSLRLSFKLIGYRRRHRRHRCRRRRHDRRP